METVHRPVMTKEVVDFINLKSGGVYADLTFGEGGHAKLLLDSSISNLFAIDRDPDAITQAKTRKYWREESRLLLYHTRFSQFPELAGTKKFDGILMDLGVSTRQLFEGRRGFSVFHEGPLDMRMDTSSGQTLEDILATIPVEELSESLFRYVDLKRSRSIARRLLKDFNAGKIKTTSDLSLITGPVRPNRSHPATPLFLALRMLVNQELEEVETTIPRLISLLKPGGRLVVLTFHSTEDRCVKRLFRSLSGACICENELCSCPRVKQVSLITPKPVVPSDKEISENPRARSTKLRVVEKI